MDCDKLIRLVYERKSLWHPDDRHYHTRQVARKMWSEIASILKTTSSNVKSKWQNLRDTYRRELMKNNLSSGSSKWKYFQQMNFLLDTYAIRQPVGNVAKLPKSEENDLLIDLNDVHVVSYNEETSLEADTISEHDGNDDDDDEERYRCLSPEESVTVETQPKRQKKKSRKRRVPIYDLIDLEKAKLVHLESMSAKKPKVEEFDEDYYFLMSLLPHLRAIPQHLKLITRVKLQQVLIENQEQFQKSQTSLQCSFHPATCSQSPSASQKLSFIDMSDGELSQNSGSQSVSSFLDVTK